MNRGHWWGFFSSNAKKLRRTGTSTPSFPLNPPPVGFTHCTVTSHSFRGLGLRKIYGTGVNSCCQAFLPDFLIICFACVSKEVPFWSAFHVLLGLDLDPLPQTGSPAEWNHSATSPPSVVQDERSLLGEGWILVLSSRLSVRHMPSRAVQKPQAYAVPRPRSAEPCSPICLIERKEKGGRKRGMPHKQR